MKVDIGLRMKNKAFVTTLATIVLAALYQILALFGVTAPISEETAVNVITFLVTIAAGIGTVIDPTTPGISD